MPDVIVIGDGPGGLSAALFLAKNGLDTVVVGQDETAMHYAMLYNYLGIPEMTGTEFQRVAREQAARHGAKLRKAHVESVGAADVGVSATLKGGEVLTARYLILSEGKGPILAGQLGLASTDAGVTVDRAGRTSADRVYAIGRMVRPGRSQAIISAGDGAAAAIDILAREKGKDRFADWDSPPK